MQTLADWRSAKQLQIAYEEFRSSDAGEAEDQTLISMMMDGLPEISTGVDVLTVEAMSSAFMKGYRQCLRNRHALRPKNFIQPEQTPVEKSPSGFDIDPVKLAKIKAGLPTQ